MSLDQVITQHAEEHDEPGRGVEVRGVFPYELDGVHDGPEQSLQVKVQGQDKRGCQ